MHLMGHKSTNQHLRYTKLFLFRIFNANNSKYFSLKSEQFYILTHIQIWNNLWPIILCNLKTKHRGCIKLYILESLWQDKQFDSIFRDIGACFNFWPMLNSQGQWRPFWKCHNMFHIRKMLLMLCLYSLPNLTLLTNTAQ